MSFQSVTAGLCLPLFSEWGFTFKVTFPSGGNSGGDGEGGGDAGGGGGGAISGTNTLMTSEEWAECVT